MKFTVPGKPFPKQRARVMRGGWAFTPKKTMQAESTVGLFAAIALAGTEDSILGPNYAGRLAASMIFFGARKNADLDNLFKLVTDACQGVLYKNDSQIDRVEIVRQSCGKGKECTVVDIQAIADL